MKAADLYETDFAQWALQNAELLRSKRFSEADLEHIAEEIEDLGKRQRDALYSRLMRLQEHLLKWRYQPERRGASWRRTIATQRIGIRRLLEQNPSLKPATAEMAVEAYADATRLAAAATSLSPAVFPADCPFTLDQLLDDEFLP
jgi:hypothetical protein